MYPENIYPNDFKALILVAACVLVELVNFNMLLKIFYFAGAECGVPHISSTITLNYGI